MFFSQESLKVEYEIVTQSKINWNGFENMKDSYKEEIKRQIKQNDEIPVKYTLIYEKGDSFFYKNLREKSSSLSQEIEYFRIKDKKGYFRLNDFIDEEFYAYYPMDNVSLEYTDETQVIENYTCKLALYKIGDNSTKVWYTEEIPISAGPYNYYGTPGLILKVESKNQLSYATSVSKNFDKKEMKKMDPKLKIYQGEELKKKNAEARENMLNHSKQKADKMMDVIRNK